MTSIEHNSEPAPDASAEPLLKFYRSLSGDGIEDVVKELSPFVEKVPGFDFPGDGEMPFVPRLQLIKKTELILNEAILPDDLVNDPQVAIALAEEHPELLLPRPAVIQRVKTAAPRSQYSRRTRMRLLYERTDAEEGGHERADLWHALAEVAEIDSTTLSWKAHDPSTILCLFDEAMDDKVIKYIEGFVRKRLPMPVMLGPALELPEVSEKTSA